jgi:hypothetical protein
VCVHFKGNNKKSYIDTCRLYTAEQIVSIFHAILNYTQTSSKRRASSARWHASRARAWCYLQCRSLRSPVTRERHARRHLLTPLKLAERYPVTLLAASRDGTNVTRLVLLTELVFDAQPLLWSIFQAGAGSAQIGALVEDFVRKAGQAA